MPRYGAGLAGTERLVGIKRNNRPYTLSRYFNETLQSLPNERPVRTLRSESRREVTNGKNNWAQQSEKLIVNLNVIAATTDRQSNGQLVEERIQDILQAYYNVAPKRVIDNIYMQVVDDQLLTGPGSPLGAFSPEWVLRLSSERLGVIAGGKPAIGARRTALMKKINDLEAAVAILRR